MNSTNGSLPCQYGTGTIGNSIGFAHISATRSTTRGSSGLPVPYFSHVWRICSRHCSTVLSSVISLRTVSPASPSTTGQALSDGRVCIRRGILCREDVWLHRLLGHTLLRRRGHPASQERRASDAAVETLRQNNSQYPLVFFGVDSVGSPSHHRLFPLRDLLLRDPHCVSHGLHCIAFRVRERRDTEGFL